MRSQSAKYRARYLHDRILRFLQEFNEYMVALDAAKYENYRKALIDRKMQPDNMMSEEADRHWGEIKARR